MENVAPSPMRVVTAVDQTAFGDFWLDTITGRGNAAASGGRPM